MGGLLRKNVIYAFSLDTLIVKWKLIFILTHRARKKIKINK